MEMFHLSKKFLVNNKFVGAFCEKQSCIVQEVYVNGKKEVFSYRHFPLPRFLTKRSLLKWEEEIAKFFGNVPDLLDKGSFIRRWLEEAVSASFAGIGNYLTVEKAVLQSPLVIVYRWNGKRLVLGAESFKPVPDKRSKLYLLPCGSFPETIEKLGVNDGNKR